MKILIFSGGLGNQIFGYAFYTCLKKKYPGEKIYGIYSHKWMSEHYGLEINKYFDVKLPVSPLLIQVFTGLLYFLKKLGFCRNKISMGNRDFDADTIVNNACKMRVDFIPKETGWIEFKQPELSEQNQQVLELIRQRNSVFLHVRRGDYYSPQYIAKLGGTCPKEYYEKAIRKILEVEPEAEFFVFSDDIQWVKENLEIPAPTYIDWNTGTNSYLDMYLMSQCSYAIIANSTFSFWGAMLGVKKKVVCYPTKWVNEPYTAPQIFPSDWVTF